MTVAIKERPILFSGEMVRAILEGRKTQTRRVVKELPGGRGGPVGDHVIYWRKGEEDPDRWCGCDGLGSLGWLKCPFGVPGDRLWVRETWRPEELDDDEGLDGVRFRADGHFEPIQNTPEAANDWCSVALGQLLRWRPSIYMPRWASRITLEVTDVRVERLREISRDDCLAEGVQEPQCPSCGYTSRDAALWNDHRLCGEPEPASVVDVFRDGWDASNTKRGSPWDTNPWVWVVEFKRVQA